MAKACCMHVWTQKAPWLLAVWPALVRPIAIRPLLLLMLLGWRWLLIWLAVPRIWRCVRLLLLRRLLRLLVRRRVALASVWGLTIGGLIRGLGQVALWWWLLVRLLLVRRLGNSRVG